MGRKRTTFAWSPVRTLMEESGAEIVARDAVNILLKYLEERAKIITNNALIFAKHSNRKKVAKKDVELAIENLH